MMKSQKGFSLIELLVATAVLLLMMAGVFSQIAKLQKAARREDVKRDMFQNGREVMDQFNRDLHSAGFPNNRMFNKNEMFGGHVSATPDQTSGSAVGLVKVSPTEIMFEGDIDQDGIVDSVAYSYVTAAPAGTPAGITCTAALGCFVRAQVQKANGNPLPAGSGGAQTTLNNYNVALENITAPAANSPVFDYFAADGTHLIPPAAGWLYGDPNLANVRTVKVTLNLQGSSPDLDTKQRPVATLTLTSRLSNY